jgi:hypothetical protein
VDVAFPTTIVYASPTRVVNCIKQYEELVVALKAFGAPPTIQGPQGRVTLKSGMMQYYNHVITYPQYPYNTIDALIYRNNAEYVSGLLAQAIVLDLGVGGATGAIKTASVLERILSAGKPSPLGLVLVDGLEGAAQEGKNAIKNAPLLSSDIKVAHGDLSESATWKEINRKINEIKNRNPGDGLRGTAYYNLVALIQSPTVNAFSDEEIRGLFNNQRNLAADNNTLFLAIDTTSDLDTLRGAYDNPPTKQFVMSAIVQHCWGNKIRINPLAAEVGVDIVQEQDWVRITHFVTDKENNVRYKLAGLRKFSEEYITAFMKQNSIELFNTLRAESPEFPQLRYGVYVCNTGPKI